MVDFGFAFGDYIAMRNGVREGARVAAVNPSANDTCTTATAPPDIPTRNLVCLTKDRIGITEDDVRIAVVIVDADGDGVEGEVGDAVRVCALTPLDSTSGLTGPFLDGRNLTSNVQMRIEVSPQFQNYNEGGVACT